MNSPDVITVLKPNQVFVYGANLAGRHGKGAALHAKLKGWANQYVVAQLDQGDSGHSWGIPTKDEGLNVLHLDEIGRYVNSFLGFAERWPELEFLVTPIGCGLAGYKPEDIAPMFTPSPANVFLPKRFTDVIWDNRAKADPNLKGFKVIPRASGTESRVIEDIINRQQKGIAKYGTTVAQNPLDLRQWLNHQYEELLDAAIYCKRAIEEMDK